MHAEIRLDRAIQFDNAGRFFVRGDGNPYLAEPEVVQIVELRVLTNVIILELLSEHGHFRCAAFDVSGLLIADDLRYLSGQAKEDIGFAIAPYIEASWGALETDHVETLSSTLSPFSPLTPEARRLLASCGVRHARAPFRRIMVYAKPIGIDKVHARSQLSVFNVELDVIRELFSMKSEVLFRNLVSGKTLQLEHPVDKTMCYMRYAICISDFHTAYCFYSADRQSSFIAVCSVHDTVIMELILPNSNIVFKNMMADEVVYQIRTYKEYIGDELTDAIPINLFGRFSEIRRIEDCIQSVLMIVREKHVGHHLWNELAGMDRLLAKGLSVPLNVVVYTNWDGEPYGRIEDILPETTGLVTRKSFNFDTLAGHVYHTGAVPLRYTSKYVTRSLAGRLAKASTASVSDAEKLTLAEARACGRTVVLLGIRLQDRTASNVFDVFAESVKVLLEERGPLTVVVDGFNTRDGVCDPAWADMMNEEILFFEKLQVFARNLDVVLVSTIGKGMYESLFWSCNSDFFVSIWGAGLAKYRWIANKPGVIISSRWNILNRTDFMIYDSVEFMEAPTQVEYIPVALVHDFITETTKLPEFANFEVAIEGWANFLRESASRQLGHQGGNPFD
ncbi:hypothetical protein [Methylobacterium oryzisoli]|uniref:hypothetical protein n=1 Tax=Methylobacterium oryzisoli TaxID=3385502 RepID=UPI003891FFAA